jgi:hypothetical protein
MRPRLFAGEINTTSPTISANTMKLATTAMNDEKRLASLSYRVAMRRTRWNDRLSIGVFDPSAG